MNIQINNVHGIEKLDIPINGVSLIGGINGTRKTTVVEIIYLVLKIYNTNQREIIFDNIDFNKLSVYSMIYGIEETYVDDIRKSNTTEDIIRGYNAFIDEVNIRLNEKLERKDSLLNYMNDDKLEVLTYETALEKWKINKVNSYFGKFEFLENSSITLVDNEFPLLKIYKRKKGNYFKIEIDDNKFLINNFNKVKINFKRSFEKIDNNEYFFNNYSDKEKGLIDGTFENISIEYSKDKQQIQFYDRDKLYPFSRVATGLIVFVYLDMLYRIRNLKDGDFLILDEPDVHLHSKWKVEFIEVIKNLKIEGVNIIFTSHDSLSISKFIENKLGEVYLLHEDGEGSIQQKKTINNTIDNELLIELGEYYFN